MKTFMMTGLSNKIQQDPIMPRQADFHQANSTRFDRVKVELQQTQR